MCFHVNDAGKHGKMAPMSNAYLAYVDCTRPGGEKMSVACAFTAGDSDNLFEGRNGIFYDRKGRDWDATITKIVSNPISIRQAFWSPYKKVLRCIQEAVAKKAAEADAAATAQARRRRRRRRRGGQDRQGAATKPEVRHRHIAALGRRGRRHRHGDRRHDPERLPRPRLRGSRSASSASCCDLRPVDVHRLAEAAAAQPRPDPRRQRLGREHADARSTSRSAAR
jgi:hypothetical protein